MDKFDYKILGMGFNKTGYAGAFTPTVNRLISQVINEIKPLWILHLFSGVSKIGDVRIDLNSESATTRADVLGFIKQNSRHWNLVILDPPYEIKRKSKLYQYGRTSSVVADVMLRRSLIDFFNKFCDNVLWLDMCAPLPKGFRRKYVWFLLPGGYHTIRVLSWLERKNEDGL